MVSEVKFQQESVTYDDIQWEFVLWIENIYVVHAVEEIIVLGSGSGEIYCQRLILSIVLRLEEYSLF